MSDYKPTNAASSGVVLDSKTLKGLSRRSDKPGLIWLSIWLLMLLASGTALYWSLGSWWVVPATLIYGSILTLPGYCLSHECGHGTAFRTRWLNETLFWITSLIYGEEPYHRRYSHARHHTYTWHRGIDSQMPFATPMTFKDWLIEGSGVGLILYEAPIFWRNATGRFSDAVIEFTPESELQRLKWGARACLAFYAGLLALVLAGYWWPLTFFIIPRLVGGIVMQLDTLTQHVEMQENSLDIRESTRSCSTNWLGRFLNMNMHHHLEHHLYPMVPFHRLPDLNAAIADQLPEPDRGFIRTNLEVLSVVVRRSLGRSTKANSIRQAPHMVTPALQAAE